ncbi:MAG: NAD(+) diphosphatase [Proteobacteria bacterium]|nr:NAD(+) diphosphatase [Pseudomonadota bacterium]
MLNNLPGPKGPHAFAGNSLNRAEHLRNDDAAILDLMASPAARFIVFWKLKPLFRPGESPRIMWLNGVAARPFIDKGANWVFLGLENDEPHFAVDVSMLNDPEREGPFAGLGTFMDPLRAAAVLDREDMGILAQAKPLIDWHGRRGFCSVCGSPTQMKQSGAARHCINDDCKAQHFPRTDPVVIMLALSGDKCLLGRQAMFPPHMFSALAGFIEPGETLEDAVRREVSEEAGIRVSDVRYHSSQPWPFPMSLMIGCHCIATDESITVDKNELDDAQWFEKSLVREALEGKRPDVLWMPPPFAIAHQLIRSWVDAD